MLKLTGLVSWLKAMAFSDRDYHRWREDEPVRQFVLCEVEVPLRLTVSQSVRLGIEPLTGAQDHILLISNHT
jgi:hypothetical protein